MDKESKEESKLTLEQRINLDNLNYFIVKYGQRGYSCSDLIHDVEKLYKENSTPKNLLSKKIFYFLEENRTKHSEDSKRIYNAFSDYLKEYEKTLN